MVFVCFVHTYQKNQHVIFERPHRHIPQLPKRGSINGQKRYLKMPARNAKLQLETREKKGDDAVPASRVGPGTPSRNLPPGLFPRAQVGCWGQPSRQPGSGFGLLRIPSVSAFECTTLTSSHLP